MIEGSSVGQYPYKKFDNHLRTTSASAIDSVVDSICSHELGAGIDSLSHRVPNIKDLISPIIDAVYHQQSHKGHINLKRIEASKHGVWQSSVYVNAMTEKFHIEYDCTNTVIVVPKQPIVSKKDKEYRFVFQIQEYMNVSFKSKYGISFMFTGKYLTHRQQCSIDSDDKTDLFFNISSYGNKRLFIYIHRDSY